MNIVVPVKTFSKNNILVNELLENFPNSEYFFGQVIKTKCLAYGAVPASGSFDFLLKILQ